MCYLSQMYLNIYKTILQLPPKNYLVKNKKKKEEEEEKGKKKKTTNGLILGIA